MSMIISSEISNYTYEYSRFQNWVIQISGAQEIAINDEDMINSENISEINFGTDITSIGYNCCAGISIKKATIQDTVTDIQPYAFYWTPQLTEISLPKNLSSLGEMAFLFSNLSTITVPEQITEIPYECFCGNQITNAVLCGQISSFSDGCFSVNGLTSIEIKPSVKYIEQEAFSYNSFESIIIPNTVQYLGRGAFASNNLTSVTILGDLDITENPFFDCPGLSSLTCYNIDFDNSRLRIAGREIANGNTLIISMNGEDCGSGLADKNVTVIGDSCFAYNTYDPPDGWQLDLSNDFDNITEIKYQAFMFCHGLTRINLGNQITSIESDAFNNTGLTAVDNIPSGLSCLNERVFCGNRNLCAIDIPDNISAIYDNCFTNCDSLMSVIMSGDYIAAPFLYGNVFPSRTKIYLKTDEMINLFKTYQIWDAYYYAGQLCALNI